MFSLEEKRTAFLDIVDNRYMERMRGAISSCFGPILAVCWFPCVCGSNNSSTGSTSHQTPDTRSVNQIIDSNSQDALEDHSRVALLEDHAETSYILQIVEIRAAQNCEKSCRS